jgi:cardiolipin synthase A/B
LVQVSGFAEEGYTLRLIILLAVAVACVGGCATREDIHYQIDHLYSVSDPQFRRSMGNLLGPPLVEGNAIRTLNNGDEAYPAMLEAIRAAEKTINIETFIYWRGESGRMFTDALVERAAAGVKVHLIIDAIGSGLRIDRKYVRKLTDAGAQVREYHPVAWYNPSLAARVNHRTHRKLLIVDGQVGFTGGMGIGDEWLGHAQDEEHWRDMHYRIEGPAVLQLQSAFCDNWMKTTGQVLDGSDYFPQPTPAGDCVAQVFKSDPNGGSQSMQLMFLMSLAAAEKHVRIGNAYFVPDRITVDALVEVAERGVKVQILVPGPHLDVKIVRPASRAQWGKLLKAGVEIYEYQPTMYHTKLLVVDERWSSVGSANIDARSFKFNDEANLNVLSTEFAREQARFFDEDLKNAVPFTYQQWRKRSLWKRISEGFAGMLNPLL